MMTEMNEILNKKIELICEANKIMCKQIHDLEKMNVEILQQMNGICELIKKYVTKGSS